LIWTYRRSGLLLIFCYIGILCPRICRATGWVDKSPRQVYHHIKLITIFLRPWGVSAMNGSTPTAGNWVSHKFSDFHFLYFFFIFQMHAQHHIFVYFFVK